MKPFTVLLLAVVVAAGTAFLVTTVRPSGPTAAATPAASPDADLQKSLRALEDRQSELAKSVDDLRLELAKKNEAARLPLGEIDAAVARALAERKGSSDAPVAAKPTAAATTSKIDLKSTFDKLLDPNLSWEDAQALWKTASDAGSLKELIAMFEDRAKQFPNDGKAQRELGKAYLQKVFTSSDMEKGMWATKADKAFDKALTIDDHDGEARLQKAISLSFWPAAFGKQNEAISHFEILAQQQEGQPLQPSFAQTHLWLGNMYLQTGQNEKAMTAWKKGLALFPDNAELKKQIEMAGKTGATPH